MGAGAGSLAGRTVIGLVVALGEAGGVGCGRDPLISFQYKRGDAPPCGMT